MKEKYYMRDDDLSISGTKLIADAGDANPGYYDVLDEVQRHTGYSVRPMNEMGIYLFETELADEGETEDGVIEAYDLRPRKSAVRLKDKSFYIKSKKANLGAIEKLLGGKEALEYAVKTGYILYNHSQRGYYIPSTGLLTSLCERAEMNSSRFDKEPSRSIFAFADLMEGFAKTATDRETKTEKPKEFTLMYRFEGDTKKAVAGLSDRYTEMSPEFIKATIKELSTIDALECERWTWSQRYTSVTMSFVNKSKEMLDYYSKIQQIQQKNKALKSMKPVIKICTSDTGDCSFTVIGGFTVGSSMVIIDEIKKKHVGEADMEKLVKEVKRTLYDKYTELALRLLDLIVIAVPSENMEEVINKALEESGLKTELGKKRFKEISDILISELTTPGVKYNAYDVATAIMEIPSRISGVNRYKLSAIQKGCYSAVFKDFYNLPTITLSDE